MVSSSPNKLFDEIRQIWVAATPEERVRQTLLFNMVRNLGYPRELIAVEKELKSLPHLPKDAPDRRVDLLCFAKGKGGLYPLILIECKEERWDQQAVEQVMGYNYYVKAIFVGLASKGEIQVGYFNPQKQEHEFISHLPRYSELLSCVQ